MRLLLDEWDIWVSLLFYLHLFFSFLCLFYNILLHSSIVSGLLHSIFSPCLVVFRIWFPVSFLKSTVSDCVGYIPVFLHMMLWWHLEFVLVCLCPLHFYSGVVLHLILICFKGTKEIPSLCLGLLIFLYWFSISLLQLVLYCIKSSNIIFSTSI